MVHSLVKVQQMGVGHKREKKGDYEPPLQISYEMTII